MASAENGMSQASTKNQSMGQQRFQEELSPDQRDYLHQMWSRATNLFDTMRTQYNQQYPEQLARNTEAYNRMQPAWQEQLNGGKFAPIDISRLQESIYSNIGQNQTQADTGALNSKFDALMQKRFKL